MLSRLKRFDVHLKLMDSPGMNKQTVLGAMVSVVSLVIVVILLISESKLYLDKEIIGHMRTDTTGGIEAINISFDIEFLKMSCDKITFLQEVTRGTLHLQQAEKINKISGADGSCRLHGSLGTDKVGGNFRFEMAQTIGNPGFPPVDISHRINHLMFLSTNTNFTGEKSPHPGISYPLINQLSNAAAGVAIHQYVLQVVPTDLKRANGTVEHLNQYSVTEREVEGDQLLMGVTLSGQYFKDFVGVLFTYDFSPIMLAMEEEQESIFEFLSNLCGIIGGVITILGLIDGMLYTSAKALIGKND